MQQRKLSHRGIEIKTICLGTITQLQNNLESINLILNDDVVARSKVIHQRTPTPAHNFITLFLSTPFNDAINKSRL